MDSRELRIGNLIELYGGHVVEVIKIFEKHLEVHSDVFQFWPVTLDGEEEGEASGIPLTEEWIENKFGFEFSHYHEDTAQRKYYVLNDFCICKMSDRYYYDKIRVEYVHDLQNIYYLSENKTELEVK